jgi:hypothetical protein
VPDLGEAVNIMRTSTTKGKLLEDVLQSLWVEQTEVRPCNKLVAEESVSLPGQSVRTTCKAQVLRCIKDIIPGYLFCVPFIPLTQSDFVRNSNPILQHTVHLRMSGSVYTCKLIAIVCGDGQHFWTKLWDGDAWWCYNDLLHNSRPVLLGTGLPLLQDTDSFLIFCANDSEHHA